MHIPVGKGWLSILRRTEKWRRSRLLFQEVQGLSIGTLLMYTTLAAMISFTSACSRRPELSSLTFSCICFEQSKAPEATQAEMINLEL